MARRPGTPAPVETAAAGRRAALERFPLLPPAEVLRNIVDFSRMVTANLGDGDLTRILYDGLRALLPGRLVAVRELDSLCMSG